MSVIVKVKIDGFDLKVYEKEGMLFVDSIKTTRQRKYRSLKSFYREVNDIKVNQIDSMLESFSRIEKSLDEKFEEQNDFLEKLKVDKKDIVPAYKDAYIQYIEQEAKKEIKRVKSNQYEI